MPILDTLTNAVVFSCNHIVSYLAGHKILFRDLVLDRTQARYNVTELPKLSERLVVFTGGTRGIGLEAMKMLLQCDMHIILACRNLAGGEKSIQSIRKSGVTTGKVTTMKLDNSSLESVRNFVREFQSKYDHLDLLVCNAGIFCPPYEETEDGFESQYAVNYLSHFLLTLLLIPSLKAGKNPQIVMVSSSAHEMGNIYWNDFNHKKNYISLDCYAQSKLAEMMFVKKLAKKLKEKDIPITINACHPGIVDTDIFISSDMYVRRLKPIAKYVVKNPTQGAVCVAYVAVSPEVKGDSGRYYYNCRERAPNSRVNDDAAQERLFKISLEQAKVKNFTL